MLSVKEKGILLLIIEHCERIEEKLIGATRETLSNNKDIEEIICFNLFQIGELAKKLDAAFLNKYDKMPWRQIKGMRDVVAHGYGTIDLDKVWKAALEAKLLREYCEYIIKEND